VGPPAPPNAQLLGVEAGVVESVVGQWVLAGAAAITITTGAATLDDAGGRENGPTVARVVERSP
jgi:hypothetical protein